MCISKCQVAHPNIYDVYLSICIKLKNSVHVFIFNHAVVEEAVSHVEASWWHKRLAAPQKGFMFLDLHTSYLEMSGRKSEGCTVVLKPVPGS